MLARRDLPKTRIDARRLAPPPPRGRRAGAGPCKEHTGPGLARPNASGGASRRAPPGSPARRVETEAPLGVAMVGVVGVVAEMENPRG
jgi:hypothetical protein